ncbi:aspartate carbamoyltransferase [Candidatus Micrarchaeota archaeon]|nr:aspartate carbamoyltransferase [Candidatus Micrarchaeota archaeon]
MDLVSIRDLEKKDIESILDRAEKISKGDNKSEKVGLKGKILATLFFEPSTRTKLSFQSAALRAGMGYLDFDPEMSSLKKGETFTDTIKVISGYADVLAIRHPKEGSARLAADISDKPVINCGDGANQHPTQTLIDLFVMKKNKGRLANLNVTLMGDLKHARTMRSLLYGLAMFGAKVTLVAPSSLEMDKDYAQEVEAKFKVKFEEQKEPNLAKTDVLYMCRIQQERFADPYEATKTVGKYKIGKEDLKKAKEGMIILNPLPKLNEIDKEVDELEEAKYFEQAHCGPVVRQAVLEYVLRA